MNAYNFIKDAIVHGKYHPGMRLTEEHLASELKLSRTPIREAIKQLKSEGLIVPLKKGVSVRHFTKEDIRQIYDLRTLLEGYAASQAAVNRTEADLLRMSEHNLQYEKAINRYSEDDLTIIKEIVEANQQFHEEIVKTSGNQHIHFHISKVVVVPLIFRSFYWYKEDKLRRSLDYHHILLDAIENRDSERARIAMTEHIYQGRDQVLKHLDDIKNKELIKEDTQ
ncbi:GntR family transcriptional regulator [Pseudalkalibacillus caeni]|uniref:GntR family transcriptional regulator n=1 Tax=Exobacillus caeni TaxID=2574798 RepID=A0A5R9EWI6_9BACL|nr:GntR family transcriptional regulator [Pseudalkalibacillus caeni]TLS35592.1 GntR family transcriptional regulator [Pseudalkalibacillus caeni]